MGNTEVRENGPVMEDSMEMYSPQLTQITRTNLLRLSRAHNKFSVILYQELTRDNKLKGTNLLLGALPMSLGLGMIYIGARGKTREELNDALQLHEVDPIILLPGLAAMHFDTFKSSVPKGCLLEVSTRLFIGKELTIMDEFTSNCNKFQLGLPCRVDFVNRSDHSRREINEEIRNATHGVVREGVPASGILDRNTKLLFSCVTHLQVRWDKPFDPKKTKKADFTVNSKETVQVPMMHQQLEARFGEGVKLDCDIVELCLANHYTKMFIFLPKKPDGLSKLERSLSRSLIHASIDGMSYEIVDVTIPKFTVDSEMSINEKLQACGLKSMFSANKANLTGMCSSAKDFSLSKAHQNIKVVVDEGEAGASSTGGGLNVAHLEVPPAMPADPNEVKTFNADRPFLFIIRDERTGAIWVFGRLCRPA